MIRNDPLPFLYNDGGRKEAGYKGDTGDCVVRAIAIASGRSYHDVYVSLAAGNQLQRKTKRSTQSVGKRTASHGISTSRLWFKAYMRKLGFTWTACMGVGTGCKVHLAQNELPDGRLVVAVSKHYVAVINGLVQDTYDPTRGGTRCVYGYWKLDEQHNT